MAPVHRGMASLVVHREGDGTSGMLNSPPGTTLALCLGSHVTILVGQILLCLLSGGFVCRFKTVKTQVLFESLLAELEGVTRNFHFAT